MKNAAYTGSILFLVLIHIIAITSADTPQLIGNTIIS
jgi:hypothetical protein